MANNPLEDITAWFNSQSPDIQKDIAAALIPFISDIALPANLNECPKILITWLDPQKANGQVTIGKSLTFKQLFEFSFHNRFSEKGWAEIKKNKLVAATILDQRGQDRSCQ